MESKRLRIVIPMLHYHPDYPSGSTRLAFDEALFLASLGHEVWVVTQDVERNKPEYSFEKGLHILRYKSPAVGAFDPRRVNVHQKRTRELLLRYIGNHADIIHGHSLLHYKGALSLYRKSVKTCYSVHSPVRLEMIAGSRGLPLAHRVRLWIVAWLANRIECQCLERTDCIMANSDFTKSLIGRLHGVNIQQRVKVIPGWVDLEKFKIIPNREVARFRLGWPIDIPVFFTLRRLVPRMGLDRLLHGVQKVKSAGYKFNLIIGGSGPLRTQLEALTRSLNIEDLVRFVGFIPDDILPIMYAAADAFVLPTAELECFGLIALESLACGRPVLATPVGAIPEIMSRFEPKWLAQNESADAIAQLLISFLKGELPAHNPESLRQRVAKYYSKDHVLEQIVIILLEGINSSL